MNLDKVRAKPFLLLMISDAVESGSMNSEQLAKIESQLVDMSLKIAKSFFSPVISHDLKKSCAIVMGVTTLGLLKLCEGDTLKARKLLLDDSIVTCFRKGWESVNNLFKAHGEKADRGALLANYQYSDSEFKDIESIHQSLVSEQLDIILLKNIATQFKNPISSLDMDPDYLDESAIQSDIQLAILEALMKRHNIGHRDYDDFKDLLIGYIDQPDVFFAEFSEAAESILEKLDASISSRIEGWLVNIEDDFVENFELLAIENSGPDVYISIFHSITLGNINAKMFMHAYESLLRSEKLLHSNLKEQIDVEDSYQDLMEDEDEYLTEEEMLGELSDNMTDDHY
jgi:hypothetical protein